MMDALGVQLLPTIAFYKVRCDNKHHGGSREMLRRGVRGFPVTPAPCNHCALLHHDTSNPGGPCAFAA